MWPKHVGGVRCVEFVLANRQTNSHVHQKGVAMKS
jgi:hypothetical protein